MFRPTTGSPLPPQLKRSTAQVQPHQFNNFTRSQTKLAENGVERSPIFPSHLDNPVNIAITQFTWNWIGWMEFIWTWMA